MAVGAKYYFKNNLVSVTSGKYLRMKEFTIRTRLLHYSRQSQLRIFITVVDEELHYTTQIPKPNRNLKSVLVSRNKLK